MFNLTDSLPLRSKNYSAALKTLENYCAVFKTFIKLNMETHDLVREHMHVLMHVHDYLKLRKKIVHELVRVHLHVHDYVTDLTM